RAVSRVTAYFPRHFAAAGHSPLLPPFPTRRSSDLLALAVLGVGFVLAARRVHSPAATSGGGFFAMLRGAARALRRPEDGEEPPRSEEHTSELQSRFDLVCRLPLEKKKYT